MQSIIAIILVLSSLAALAAPREVAPKKRMVVVISLDGFPGFALQDPKLPVPTLRSLIRKGTWSRMHPINPTITWPNHTTMVTGVGADEHGLLLNGTIVRTNGWPPVRVDPYVEKEKMVHAPTVYDAAHKARLTTAQVDWVAINKASTITWPFGEWVTPEDPVAREMIKRGALTTGEVTEFTKFNIVWRDQVWTKAAAYLIREHKPNLMLFHLLTLDATHHRYGPNNLGAMGAMAFLDSCVAQIVASVEQAGMTERTTFLVVSDHGFKGYTNEIRTAVALGAAGLTNAAYVLPEGGSGFLYLNSTNSPEVSQKVLALMKSIEGIGDVVTPERFAALGLPQPNRDPQMFDIFLTAKPGYSFSGATGGAVTAAVPQLSGSHGYIASDPDLDAIFIASGYGVTPGVKLEQVRTIDVAPTIAKLLGVPFPSAKGKPLPLR
ncbi:MAG TPA: ectonucleotide pyrophosphatase/phosphodiesterase [Candidatus Saccharimonadales bacterium]|nr:ectonucleotide pyrophosphatase/phosphodiesterase [Candidatus Saccharimonadales bacterium]